MEGLQFVKMCGSGNDFVFIDNMNLRHDVDALAPEFVKKVCRRGLSVGADGVVFIEPSDEADFKWRFFNSDGSEAEMCGNAGRCAVKFARMKGIASSDRVRFLTMAGIIEGEIKGDRVRIFMGEPSELRMDEEIEAAGKLIRVSSINTGVPHAVIFVDDLQTIDVVATGRAIRYHEKYRPKGTNVDFVAVLESGALALRTYERGVEDETLACGTGIVAVALVAAAKGIVRPPVKVHPRGGGYLVVDFERNEGGFRRVSLEGDARVIYEATLGPDALA